MSERTVEDHRSVAAPLRAAFVALHALPAVSSKFNGPIGGTETRAWRLARGVTKYVSDVRPSLVVRGRRSDVPASVDGVQLIAKPALLYDWYVNVGRSVRRKHGFPPVEMTRADPKLLWQLPVVATHWALRRQPKDPRTADRFFSALDADVFVAFGVQSTAARVVASAQATGRRSVVVLGCDEDLDKRYLSDPGYVNPYGDSGAVCRWILESADAIVVQTEWQRTALQQRFGRDGHWVRNPIDVDQWANGHERTLSPSLPDLPDRFALWVGRAERVHKRPQCVIELAHRCPGVTFVMVMNPADPQLGQEIIGNRPRNVCLIDRVSPDDMPALFSRAAVLVNTSSVEGFPNTYLQAAATGIPVLSLNVLGDFLVENGLGLAFHDDIAALATAVDHVFSVGPPDAFDASRCEQFVRRQHDLPEVAKQFADVLQQVARKPLS